MIPEGQPASAGRLLGRFVGDLTGLVRVLPLALVLIMAASTLPQLFIWAVGHYAPCLQSAACTTPPRLELVAGFTWELSLRFLVGIVAFAIAMRTLAWMVFEVSGIFATTRLHDRMISGLAGAATSTLDTQASGHIIGRVLGDFANLRAMGIVRLGDSTNAMIEVIATTVVVGLASPWAAMVLVPAAALFLVAQANVGPMLARVEALASQHNGELVHRATDLIEGRSVFGLYGRMGGLLKALADAARRQVEARVLQGKLQAYARLWTRGIAAGYGSLVFFLVAWSLAEGVLTPAMAGVVLSSVFALSGSLGWLSWTMTSLNETLANVQRVYELVDLPPEETLERADGPARREAVATSAAPVLGLGAITFSGLTAAYVPGGPSVLRDISLTIPAGSRIGLVGRTGAGKSTILQALMRMLHVTSGDIDVDGKSIYDLPLVVVRSAFGVVPQNPYLFSGTVATNLTRGAVVSPEEAVQALTDVGLGYLALSQPVTEGGLNLSLGERQLLCLARILLRGKPFVILDEPTSAIDPESDAKVRRVLFERLAGRTMIVVAHRPETLADLDQVIEIEAGQVVRVESVTGAGTSG